MPIEWSSDGRDLHLDLDRSLAPGRALADAIRSAIRAGRLTGGKPMPSTRALAADLNLARGTVTRVYEQLRVEGFLSSRQGAATTVAARLPGERVRDRLVEDTAPAARWQLVPGLPDVNAFPRADWLAATRRVLSGMPADALGRVDPRGHPVLRAALTEYLGRARGVRLDPDRVLVCAGYSHGLSLLAKAFAAREVFAFENASLPAHREIVAAAGLRLTGVPVDADGALVSTSDAPVVVLTPAHQYPLGHTLAPQRRAALAESGPAVVIEDDYDGEFRYDRQPVGAVQALAPERVIYAGTASKTLAPGLRLGWLVLPRKLVGAVAELLGRAENRVPVLHQLALAELLTGGGYDRQVRRMRTIYRRRRDRLLAMIGERADPTLVEGISAGLHLVLRMPEGGPSEADIHAVTARHGLAVHTLGPHWMDEAPHRAGMVIGYAAPAEHAFNPALSALESALGELLR